MLPPLDPVACAALADDLRDADYRSDRLREAWGVSADDAISRGMRIVAERALGGRTDPLAVLGRLFVLGLAQDTGSVAAALPRAGVTGLVDLGLAVDEGRSIRPLVLLRPQSFVDDSGEGEWWIASDLDETALQGALPESHVLGVGGASLTLAGLQLPVDAASGLDIGAGCGIQSLRARRNVDHVVATDISERALWFTRLNALLNGVDRIETRFGSLFDPVEGEVFDRIVSNPPFVITPRVDGVPAYEYRDGGMVGDALVEAVVSGVGAHLASGGVAQLLGNWETRDGRDGLARVRDWVESSSVPLDAWVIEREALDPLSYAELWIRDGGTLPGSPAFAALVDAWLHDFEDRGVTGVGFGYVLLRRPPSGDAPTLARYERVGTSLGSRALGGHLAQALAVHDRLDVLDDAQLAASVLLVTADVTEARHHVPGAEEPTVIELRQGGAFSRTITVDPGLAALVGACDGDLAVGVLSDAIAHLLDVDPRALLADLLPKVRELLFSGFLVFAASEGVPSEGGGGVGSAG
ncbi:methyltransferase [Microbacterium sp. P02]|uniref:DUF7059 domain-containing protein n=1 Tax=Microbacterium sp. P02 TaxID=3366260 RepID=UPI003671A247